MKIYKYDCIGRVPSSIQDLEKCETCQNEEICAALWNGFQAEPQKTSSYALEEEREEYTINVAQRA